MRRRNFESQLSDDAEPHHGNTLSNINAQECQSSAELLAPEENEATLKASARESPLVAAF